MVQLNIKEQKNLVVANVHKTRQDFVRGRVVEEKFISWRWQHVEPIEATIWRVLEQEFYSKNS